MRIRLLTYTQANVGGEIFPGYKRIHGVFRMCRFVRCMRVDLCMYFDANAVASVNKDEILSAL